jgi:hypothetical protein
MKDHFEFECKIHINIYAFKYFGAIGGLNVFKIKYMPKFTTYYAVSVGSKRTRHVSGSTGTSHGQSAQSTAKTKKRHKYISRSCATSYHMGTAGTLTLRKKTGMMKKVRLTELNKC